MLLLMECNIADIFIKHTHRKINEVIYQKCVFVYRKALCRAKSSRGIHLQAGVF